MKPRKIILIIMTFLILLPIFASCTGGNDTSDTNSESANSSNMILTIGKSEFKIEKINVIPKTGEIAIFDRDYKDSNGKYLLSVGETVENTKAVTVKMKKTNGEFEFEVISVSDNTASAAIPTNGFVVLIPNDKLEEVKEGILASLSGGDKLLEKYERTDLAKFYPTKIGNSIERRINLVDPEGDFAENKIYFLNENYSIAGKELPKNIFAVSLKKSSSNNYEITKTGETLTENEYRLVFTGEYNVEYAKTYMTVGEKIMINSLDKANAVSDTAAVLFENKQIIFEDEKINSETLENGFYLYTNEFLGVLTPKTESERVDVVIVEDTVAEISNDRAFIPSGNGIVVTCVGTDAAAFAKSLNVGEKVKEKYFVEYESLSDKYVTIGGVNFDVDIVNDIRTPEGVSALYTPEFGKTTETNMYGTEIVVSNGKVIKVEKNKGNAEIPADGFVLSIHKDHVKINEANRVRNDMEAELHLDGSDYRVIKLHLDGINTVRGENMIIIYRDVATTDTNMYGYEIIVDNNNLSVGDSYSGNATVPSGGFVVSGHGNRIKLLESAYSRGEIVTYDEKNSEILIIKTPRLRIGGAEDAINAVIESFDEAKKEYKAINFPYLTEEIAKLKTELEKAKTAIADGNFESAMDISKKVKADAEILKLQTIESRLAQNRAMWYRSSEKSDNEVRATIEKLKALNVNTLYLETWYDGYCTGYIDVEGVKHSPYNGDYDALEGFIRIGHENGIEVHAWVENFFVGYLNKDGTFSNDILNHFKNQLLLDSKGNNFYYYNEKATFVFLNPFDRECRDYILDVYSQLIDKYDLDGIHLDYIRFPELNYGTNDYGYNADIIAAFQKETGITADPRTFTDGTADRKKWEEFRANIITSFVEEIFELVCEKSSDMWISCATYPDRENSKKNIAQDVETWVNKGYIDEVFSMTYSGDNNYVYENALGYAKMCDGKSFYSTGLAAFMDTTSQNFAHQLPSVTKAGADGIAIFALANINPNHYQNEIILGAFRERSIQLNKYGDTVKAHLAFIENKLNWSLSFYESITESDVSAIISEMKKIKCDVGTDAPSSEKIKYCTDTVKELENLKKFIIDKCGKNVETDSITCEIDELIYALTICSDRSSIKNK